MDRRNFLRNSGAIAVAAGALRPRIAWTQAAAGADYTIHIAPVHLEIAPKKIVKTTAFNGRVPGRLVRVTEGKQVTIDVVNDTDKPDIVHWHGLHIPSDQDGAAEEGSPVSAPHGGVQRYRFIARPAGFRWYHSHTFAGHNLNRAMYSGEYGFLMIDPVHDPARYDREVFLALHDWNGYISGGSDGYQEVAYNYATVNGKMLGHGEPVRVRPGERVLFHVLNASATLAHTLALPGHQFLVTALDGNPVPSPQPVNALRLGPAERVDAVVRMTQPGVWVLGETDDDLRKAGMGIVLEYADRSGAPAWRAPAAIDFHYERFGKGPKDAGAAEGEIEIPLVFRPKFEGYGDFDHWTINGRTWPKTKEVPLTENARYRLVLDNQSDDVHPIHLHRHTFELRSMHGRPTSGILKDVLLLPTRKKTEISFTANNPGKTLFHCHQQDHMDSGFMMLFHYV